jgi:hypothetical protein
MAQATAMQALTKGYQVLGNRVYLDAARSALGAFATGPPVGVRVPADGGNHYLIYSFAPRQRVLNAFLQSLIGLYDYAKLSGDQAAWALFRAGDRAARREVPRYDTGAWSLYSPGEGEANLDYHKLVRDFLRGLCERTGSAVYCRTAARFTDFLSQPPGLRFAGPLASRRGRPAVVQVVISKISCVRIRVRRGGRPVFEAGYVFPRGRRAFSFTPRAPGTYAIEVQATDPAGNRAILSGTLHATS